MQGKEWHNLRNIFTFADSNTDFEALKRKGVKSVLIKHSSKISKDIKKASALGLKIMVEISHGTKDTVKVIGPLGGRVCFDAGEIEYVSTEDIKTTLKSIGGLIDKVSGFVLPVPKVSGLLWNDEIEAICQIDDDELYDLFDEDKEISEVRSVYYKIAERYVLEKYIVPLDSYLKNIKRRSVFYIGKNEMYYDFVGKHINPFMLKNAGLCIGVFGDMETARVEFGIDSGDFVFNEESCEKITLNKTEKIRILLVKPTRGTVERYVWTGKRNRMETPALSSAVEGIYWSEKLNKKGYFFDVAEDTSFSSKKHFGKYRDIIICKSCLFTDKEISKINILSEKGVRINSAELIDELIEQGEE